MYSHCLDTTTRHFACKHLHKEHTVHDMMSLFSVGMSTLHDSCMDPKDHTEAAPRHGLKGKATEQASTKTVNETSSGFDTLGPTQSNEAKDLCKEAPYHPCNLAPFAEGSGRGTRWKRGAT